MTGGYNLVMGEHSDRDKHGAHRKLVARLRSQSGDVTRLTAGLDEEALSRRTIPGKWSIKELVAHLWRVEIVFERRVESMLAEENPAIERYDPEGDPDFAKLASRDGADLRDGFQAARERFARRLEAVAPADWHRRGRHPEFPLYDVHFQIEYMAHHEAHHVYQIYQRRAGMGRIPHG